MFESWRAETDSLPEPLSELLKADVDDSWDWDTAQELTSEDKGK